MKIEIWSDYICPYCYISNVNFAKALAAFPEHNEVNLLYHAFQLMPEARYESKEDYYGALARESKRTVEEVKARNRPALALANKYNVAIFFEKIYLANTDFAHKISYFAQAQGLQQQWVKRVFKAYFLEGLNIGDETTLRAMAADVGLFTDKLHAVLTSEIYAERMKEDRRAAYQINFETIPYYLINGKIALPLTLGPTEYLEVLKQNV